MFHGAGICSKIRLKKSPSFVGKYTTSTMEDMGILGGVNYKNWEMIKQKVTPDVFFYDQQVP